MSAPTLREILPPIYHPLLPSFFDVTPPAEEKATCHACVMVPPAGMEAPAGVAYFRPDTKCCTYHPTLANYLVGGLLSDPDPDYAEGQRRVRATLATRIGVKPAFLT